MTDAIVFSVTDWIVAVASSIGAIATCVIALVTYKTLPSIRQRLTQSNFITNELGELFKAVATGPNTPTRFENDQHTDPALLVRMEVGRHDPVFDRVVFEFIGTLPSYTIEPLNAEMLIDKDVQGVWGLSVQMHPCRIRYVDGPNAGDLSVKYAEKRPNFPSVIDHRLINESDATCEWVIGTRTPTSYLPFSLSDPPRIVIDFFRSQPLA